LAPSILRFTTRSVGRLVKLLMVFASTVISGFSLLEIRDQEFYSLLHMYVSRNGASSSTKEESAVLCRRYVCCTVVSARVYPTVTASRSVRTLCTFCHCTILTFIQDIQRFPVNAGLCSRLCLTYVTTLKPKLVNWTVVGLTVAKFKPLILPMTGFSLSNTTYIWIYKV
jgi:hypothetical protein